jgi:hypothetical protein
MKVQQQRVTAAVLAFAFAWSYLSQSSLVNGQRRDPQAQRLEDRDRRENGITVTEPRVFDDAQLQQRLEELEARLATLQVIDQKALTDRFGTTAGASLRSSGFALNVQGPPVPGVTTTTKLPTEQTTTTTAAGATSSGITTVSNLATKDVTTTTPQFSPPPATAPVPTVNMPSAFSVSSSDVLDEMMQLTAEINGLRLLLSGDLSSHYIRGGQELGNKMTKLKTTLGFDISVKPDAVRPKERYKDAVAVVEVEVENVCETVSNEPPAITALLPREKTYNVAEISDRSTSIGGGVATQILGVSGSWLLGHKTHYLVRDQDTVALTFTPEEQPNDTCKTKEGAERTKKRVGFMWQFRPVLGRRYVGIAEKTTFVQLAFAVPRDAKDNEIGKVTVRTYWRGYDLKRGVHKEVIPGSVREQIVDFDIPRYKLAVEPSVFNFRDNLEDLGGGQVLVKLPGDFLPGTSVRIGSTVLGEGNRFQHRYSEIRFVAALSDLATKRVYVVAHDGTEVPLVFGEPLCNKTNPLLIVGTPEVTTVDETNSRVSVKVNHPGWAKVKPEDWLDSKPPIVFVIGERVFGFSDAPLQRNGNYLSFVAPTALLVANTEITVQTLFPAEYCMNTATIPAFQPPSQTERLTLLEQGEKTVKFLLYGTRLSGLTVLAPAHSKKMVVTVTPVGNPSDADRLLLVEMDVRHLKTHKNLLVQRPNERPFLIPIPLLEPAKKPEPPKAQERITVGADEVVIVGEGLKDVAKVFFKKRQFDPGNVERADDGKSLRLSGLTGLGVTSTAATQPIVLEFKSGAKVTVNVEVVSSKVETVPR